MITTSYLLKPEVSFQLFKPKELEQWKQKLNLSEDTQNFNTTFVYFADDDFLNFIKQDKNLQLELVKENLYKIVKKP